MDENVLTIKIEDDAPDGPGAPPLPTAPEVFTPAGPRFEARQPVEPTRAAVAFAATTLPPPARTTPADRETLSASAETTRPAGATAHAFHEPAGPRFDPARLAEAIDYITKQPGSKPAGLTAPVLSKMAPAAVIDMATQLGLPGGDRAVGGERRDAPAGGGGVASRGRGRYGWTNPAGRAAGGSAAPSRRNPAFRAAPAAGDGPRGDATGRAGCR